MILSKSMRRLSQLKLSSLWIYFQMQTHENWNEKATTEKELRQPIYKFGHRWFIPFHQNAIVLDHDFMKNISAYHTISFSVVVCMYSHLRIAYTYVTICIIIATATTTTTKYKLSQFADSLMRKLTLVERVYVRTTAQSSSLMWSEKKMKKKKWWGLHKSIMRLPHLFAYAY